MLSCGDVFEQSFLAMNRGIVAQIVWEFSKKEYRQNNHNPVSSSTNQPQLQIITLNNP